MSASEVLFVGPREEDFFAEEELIELEAGALEAAGALFAAGAGAAAGSDFAAGTMEFEAGALLEDALESVFLLFRDFFAVVVSLEAAEEDLSVADLSVAAELSVEEAEDFLDFFDFLVVEVPEP
jgi:hypothetical protein